MKPNYMEHRKQQHCNNPTQLFSFSLALASVRAFLGALLCSFLLRTCFRFGIPENEKDYSYIGLTALLGESSDRNDSVPEGPNSNQAEFQGCRRPNRMKAYHSYARRICSWKGKAVMMPRVLQDSSQRLQQQEHLQSHTRRENNRCGYGWGVSPLPGISTSGEPFQCRCPEAIRSHQ